MNINYQKKDVFYDFYIHFSHKQDRMRHIFIYFLRQNFFLSERILDRINILQFLLFFRLQMYIINVEAMNVKDFSVVVIHNFK